MTRDEKAALLTEVDLIEKWLAGDPNTASQVCPINCPTLTKVAEWVWTREGVLSPEHHANHHADPSRNYGVLNGWSNYVLNIFTRGDP